ncbi:nuclear pore complex protein Nup205-like [Mercenaria mercenaria]|uniref:nuclear pore complex protein Nup205-like n=1 Tax=Mercenaria mercenaria TaxID=6596 RepID=UPI00234EF4D9|nr:nuclear pore complex protein Nup205-like [Mercenaria mercenaria]
MAASGVAVNAAARVWSPFKDLQNVVEAAIHKRQTDAIHDLEVMLKRHKNDFLTLLKNIPKNATHREAVKKSNTVGLPIHGEQRTQTFPDSFIEEAIIISDLFDLNEFAALELLIAGEDNRPDFPGLTRGLVAVLLYYDGRRSLVNALRTLLLALSGRTWTLGLSPDLTYLTNSYVQKLVEENLTNKILDVLKTMNVTTELDKLQNNRAIGPPKHKKQIQDMYEEIQVTCAECLFCLACQKPLSRNDTLQLISYLKNDNSLQADGSLTPVTLCVLMALLYCFDVSVLEREDAEEITGSMPVFSDPNYISDVHKELKDGAEWQTPELRAVVRFAWGVMLRQLSQYPLAAGAGEYYEEDEMFMDLAIEGQVFSFLHKSVVSVEKLHKEEFHVRRLHGLLTDFIYYMPLKVKEIRNRGDETARIMMAHLQEGQDPPASLRRDFEHLLYLIYELYEKDPLNLDLSLDYWCPEPTSQQESFHHRPPQRQVALYKFVRMAGDLLPASLYVPYIKMLIGLASTTQCAQHCYYLIKNNGSTSSTVSWDHIFTSLNQYYNSLRRESPHSSDPSTSYRLHSRVITPQELEGLVMVLQLVRRVCEQSENCRIAIYENQQWSVVMLLFGLVSCSVPPQMKAELLKVLASLARTPEYAATLWQTLEGSQVLVTVQQGSGKQSGGIQVELDEVESRNEEYPITCAFLEFLAMLTDTPIPAALGAGSRAPGFDPYLLYVRDDVFLKFGARAYKNPGEKWEVAALSLGILRKLLQDYEIQGEHFTDQVVETGTGQTIVANKPAGFTLMVNMLRDSRLYQMILRILNDAMNHFESYTTTPGQKNLEKAALLCLQMIEITLEKEELFVDMVRDTGSPLLVTPMDRLLLGINPRTGKADYIVTVAKYMMFNSTMPEHTLAAMRILYMVGKSSTIQSDLVTLFTENKESSEQLLHGFVECLDTDDPEDDTQEEQVDEDTEVSSSKVRNSTRQYLLKLMINSLEQPAPNLAHFLLGFELRKPVSKTNLQDQGVLTSPKTCLHSVLTILTRGIGAGTGPQCLIETPKLAELGYRLIYMLAANKDASLPTLRYLRTSHDFLYRQLQHLPYEHKNYKHSVMNHQSWLLKTVAVELRVTSINRQRSHTQRLMKLILDDYDEDQTSVLQPVGQGPDESEYFSASRLGDLTASQYTRTVKGRQYRRRIMSLLDTVQFSQQYPDQIHLEFFDYRLIQQVITSVERKDEGGVTFYDVKSLYRILMNELNNLQGTTMAGQRQMIIEEIEGILRMVIERNKVCQSLHSKHQAFDSWRQVTEIILTACPEDLLQGETRQTVLFELLQDLLMKVADENALPELTAPVAGVILTLMANLRQCFVSEDQDPSEKERRDSQYITLLDRSQTAAKSVSWGQGSGSGSRTLFATSLQMVLKGMIEHILRSSGGQQRVRAKLYGALLYYLQIANKPKVSQTHLLDEAAGSVESRLLAASDSEYDQLRKENISSILSYGDTFMDLLCRDACDGLDVGRMLALSVLDCILMMDKFNQWLTFISSKGYLQHLVDSLSADDDKLMSVLAGSVDNLKVLYLYESKLSLLTRAAETAVGASTLLRCGVMEQLAACSFFDMRPDIDRGQTVYGSNDAFLPDPVSRYRHLLFTSLRFCLALLTSLGVENREAGIQVMQFVVAHGDIFHSILLDRQQALNLYALQELALTTAVISRANCQEEDQYAEVDSAEIEFRGHRVRIQRHMVALLPKYCVSEKLNKQLKNLDIQQEDEKRDLKAEVMQAYLEVATNVTSYCRALVSNSGPNVQYCRVLFWPNLEEAMARDIHASGDFALSTLSPAQVPNLGIVVYQLKQCTNHFMRVYENRKQHLSKLEGLSDLSVEDLKQFSTITGEEKMSSQVRQVIAKKRLSQLIAYNYKELQAYSYIIENSLFLLWRHLEYYLLHCVPADKGQSQYQSQARKQLQMRRLQDIVGISQSPMERSGSGENITAGFDLGDSRQHVRQQDIDTLKQAAITVLSDSLFKKIQEINVTFCKSRSHYGFVEAVIRRIKRLLRLHTGS